MRRFVLSPLLGFLLCVLGDASTGRTWTDSTGKHKVEAELVHHENGVVRLRKPDGKTIDVPIDALSTEDARYVRDHGSKPNGPVRPTTFRELESLASKQKTAEAVVKLYVSFLADKERPEAELEKAQARYPFWERLAREKRIRLGRDWLAPEKAKEAAERERALIEEALRLIEVKSFPAAGERLLEASKANPGGVKANFLLGLYHALYFRSAVNAEKHFAECVSRRMPDVDLLTKFERANLVGALNNLALTEMRTGKQANAAKHWKLAIELAPTSAEVLQNLGRAVHLAGTRRLGRLSPGAMRELSALYASASVAVDAGRFDPATGWLYLHLFPESDSDEAPPGAPDVDLDIPGKLPGTPISSGSGFVVHRGYILTNYHVVEDAPYIFVTDPANTGLKHRARIVAVLEQDDLDLALLRCEGLVAPSLPLSLKLPRLGEDIVVLGYPQTDALGTSLKVVKGTIAGLPNPTLNYLLYDAAVNPGNSGGPTCDQTGCVVAVCTILMNLESKLGGGVPIERAIALLKEHIPEFGACGASRAADQTVGRDYRVPQ